jgi:hypothetical protein
LTGRFLWARTELFMGPFLQSRHTGKWPQVSLGEAGESHIKPLWWHCRGPLQRSFPKSLWVQDLASVCQPRFCQGDLEMSHVHAKMCLRGLHVNFTLGFPWLTSHLWQTEPDGHSVLRQVP